MHMSRVLTYLFELRESTTRSKKRRAEETPSDEANAEEELTAALLAEVRKELKMLHIIKEPPAGMEARILAFYHIRLQLITS